MIIPYPVSSKSTIRSIPKAAVTGDTITEPPICTAPAAEKEKLSKLFPTHASQCHGPRGFVIRPHCVGPRSTFKKVKREGIERLTERHFLPVVAPRCHGDDGDDDSCDVLLSTRHSLGRRRRRRSDVNGASAFFVSKCGRKYAGAPCAMHYE